MAGDSEWSESATGTPKAPAAQKPDAPSALTVNAGDGELEVSWTAPSDNVALISGYDVWYRVTTNNILAPWTKLDFKGTGTSTTIDGLTNGESYQVQVRASNSVTVSDWSDIAMGTPEPSISEPSILEPPISELVVIEWGPLAPGGSISEDTDTSENRVEIAEIRAIDPEVGDSPVYNVDDTTHFEVDDSSLYLKQDVKLDHETTPSYRFIVTATGDGVRVTSSEQTLTVTDVNESSVANDDEVSVVRGGSVTIESAHLLENDTDPDGDELGITGIDNVKGGKVVPKWNDENTLMTVTYTHRHDSEPNEEAGFTYTVSDGKGSEDTGRVVINVTTTDDEGDEGEGAIARLGRVNETILPELSRSMVSVTMRSVADRIEEARTGIAGKARVEIAGYSAQTSAADMEALEAVRRRNAWWQETPEAETMDWKDVLGSSSFVLPLGSRESESSGDPSKLTVWGGGDWRSLSGGDGESAVEWDGNVVGARIGMDARLRDDLLAGLVLSWSRGWFDWTDRGGAKYKETKGKQEGRITSLHPYLGWWLGDRGSLWVSLGHGRGEVEIEEEQSGRHSSDAVLNTAAAGGHKFLLTGDEPILGGIMTSLALKGEAWTSRFEIEDNGHRMAGLAVNTHSLRLSLEGTYERSLDGGGSLTPSLEAGLRQDAGDGAVGLGLELGGGLVWRNPALGLTMKGQGRVLLMHQGSVREWGASGSVLLEPGADLLGLSFELQPSWGAVAEGGVDRLWEDGPDSPFNRAPVHDAARLEAELGYGLRVLGGHGVLTPYGGMSLSDSGSRSWRVGGRLGIGPSLTLGLEGERRESVGTTRDHRLMLTGTVRW